MRFLTTAARNAFASDRVSLAYMVTIDLPAALGGALRFTTNAWTFNYGGVEWMGAGGMLNIEFPNEDSTLEVHPATITLDGLEVAVLSLALNERLDYTTVHIDVLSFDPDTQAVLASTQWLRGTMSNLRILPPSSSGGDS